MNQKKLGVLGGMGPAATSLFFDRVIENTVAGKDQDHIDMVILNHATIPDRTRAILEDNKEPFLEAVKKDFELFEVAGVDNIAIPCNTSHYYFDEMQAMTNIKIINMIEETANYIRSNYGPDAKVGILATDGTINTGIYQDELHKYNMKAHIPDVHGQKQVMQTIYDFKADKPINIPEFERIIQNMLATEDCDCVILGCTELSCIEIGANLLPYCVDAMQVLVNRAITYSGKELKNQAVCSKLPIGKY
ncbi:aspartate/glutamate racemase family protein [Ornithinibacillus scapharcae]|uniref:aspartate/glutamate racemase family protein n=1 Tax=Ornithinibacillus scapharcae TaxID=1147159 RepID=UPI000225B3D6|nr:amino acid racemase [Ornithinibacillus scapharcae]